MLLSANKGCFLCIKPCQFNGLCVSPDSTNALKDSKDWVNKQDRYNCNTTKRNWRK